jgi:hypothetical protein
VGDGRDQAAALPAGGARARKVGDEARRELLWRQTGQGREAVDPAPRQEVREQVVLTLAAREANIVGIHYKVNPDNTVDWEERTAGALSRKVAWIRRAAGEGFDELELNLLMSSYMVVTDDGIQAAEQLIQKRGWSGIAVEQVLDLPYELIGSVEQIAEKIHLLRERHGVPMLPYMSSVVMTLLR